MSALNFLPLSSNQASTNTAASTATNFTLDNNSNETLNLYWIDTSGNAQLYKTLTPGQTYEQLTQTTHVWEVTSTDGAVGFKFEDTSQGIVTVGANNQPTFTDQSERIISTPQGLWSTYEGYGLINVAKSLGVTDLGGNLPVVGQNNNSALDAISASSAWAAGYTGKGVTVAVVDVGIASNPEVNANIVGSQDFADNTGNSQPDNGAYQDHPLGVASIIAGSHTPHSGPDTMGVAPDASLLNVKVGTSAGSSSDNVAAGIHWAVDNGAKVICMPLENDSTVIDQQIADAVHYAFQHNVVTVIIGGNYTNFGPSGPALISQIANESIDVGNYNTLQGTLFASSNESGSTPFNWVDASSSGYTPTAAGGYSYHEDGGTSFAGPYVAGLAALLFQQNPNATASEIMNKIIAGASLGNVTVTDAIQGTAGNDSFNAPAGGGSIIGNGGVDTVTFTGASSQYTVTATATGETVVDHSGTGGTLNLTGIDRLVFSDTGTAYDTVGGGTAGEVYRLYQAAFDRAPDVSGLGFWMNAMDSGVTLNNVATGFVQSAEFQKLYGVNPTVDQLVNAMYENVLHRAPEAAGLQFWENAMNNGTTAAQLLVSFSDSAENQANAVKIIGQGTHYTPFHG